LREAGYISVLEEERHKTLFWSLSHWKLQGSQRILKQKQGDQEEQRTREIQPDAGKNPAC
jgi:hypothetical protein